MPVPGLPGGSGSSRPGRLAAAGRAEARTRGPSAGARLPATAPRPARGPSRRTAGSGPGALARANGRPSDAAVSAASTSRSCTTSMWSLTKPTGTTTTPDGARGHGAPSGSAPWPAPPGGRSRPAPARARSAGRCGSGRRGRRGGCRRAPVRRSGLPPPAAQPRTGRRPAPGTAVPGGHAAAGGGHAVRDAVRGEHQAGARAGRRRAARRGPPRRLAANGSMKPGWLKYGRILSMRGAPGRRRRPRGRCRPGTGGRPSRSCRRRSRTRPRAARRRPPSGARCPRGTACQFRFPQYSGRSMPPAANAAPTAASRSRHWPLIGLTPPRA